MQIEVTAYQWWWSAEYQHPEPAQRVRTANELHIPVGRTVAIKLLASDVIHSFWVPSLSGKLDAIPGHEAVLWLRADEPAPARPQARLVVDKEDSNGRCHRDQPSPAERACA